MLDKSYDIKILDFGFATPISGRDGQGESSSVIGTPGYMAPEILKRKPYEGKTTDIFSLGVIFFIF